MVSQQVNIAWFRDLAEAGEEGLTVMLGPENWKNVPKYFKGLQASSWGRVRVLPYKQAMPAGGFRWRETKPTWGIPDDEGRPKVKIKGKTYRVCDLVCRAFHGNPRKRAKVMLVRHLDENNQNNLPGNLKWGTNSENQLDPKLRAHKVRIGKERIAQMVRVNGKFLRRAA